MGRMSHAVCAYRCINHVSIWITGIIDGSYQRSYKSAPVPSERRDGFVTVVVGSTFDDIVLDPQKDVMLMVYTTW